ncbi:ABC transporter permease [Dethiosulfatarculus sandiegensis]|uniref:ABC transporter permease n=1 Tax=Dethiosulfatarculus sandiegensis TaxID=1429043 RepID=A0A0D2J4L5_9BACT|nr:ABC transporter permease subunit [Dethiosulfatarculus sandiegensis]KIX13034.1 ABC transporter permease [Dethiosulfatarculus sandiegensis]
MRRRWLLFLLAGPGALFLLLFFLTPLFGVVTEAFGNGGVAFWGLFEGNLFWSGLKGSIVLATVTAGVSLMVGFGVAYHLARLSQKVRSFLLALLSLPLTFSGLIVAYGFILSFGRAGFITLLLAKVGVDPTEFAGFIYSPYGLGFAYAYYLIPRVVLIILPVLINFDSSQLLAAQSLGASRFRSVAEILLPQIMPSLFTAYCLVAAVALGAYGTALALVGTQVNILPLQLFSKISETGSDFPAAAALSVVLLALCSFIMAAGEGFASFKERGHQEA